jgi:multiple sugar transport system permease protein
MSYAVILDLLDTAWSRRYSGLSDIRLLRWDSRLLSFHIIILPISTPGLVSTALFSFLLAWDEFFFALLFTSTVVAKTMPVAIGEFAGRVTRWISWQ